MQNPQIVFDQFPGGNQSALNLTAAVVIATSRVTACRLSIVAPGSAGNLILNDCTSLGAADGANQIFSAAYSELAQGQPLVLDWPCLAGLVLSAIPTGGVIALSLLSING